MSEHKPNGSKTDIQQHPSEMLSTAKSSVKSVAAELSAKITAKQNSRLKQQQAQPNGTKINKHMEPPKQKSQHGLSNHKLMHHDVHNQTPYIDSSKNTSSTMLKSSFHNFHDVENHLSSSKISINDFKSKASAPVALNLKRNYL